MMQHIDILNYNNNSFPPNPPRFYNLTFSSLTNYLARIDMNNWQVTNNNVCSKEIMQSQQTEK